MRLGISRPFAVGVVAAVVVLTLLADVAKDSSQSTEIEDLRSQLEDVRMQLNRTGQRDLALWDATVAVEERIRLKVKDAMELEYGLAKQGELMVKLAHEVKKLKTAVVPARDRRSMTRTFKHIGTTAAPHKPPSCVYNPPLHYEYTGDLVKECTHHLGKRPVGYDKASYHMPTKAYMLSLNGKTKRFDAMASFLAGHDIELELFEATDGNKKYSKDYSMEKVGDRSQMVLLNNELGTKIPRGTPGFLMAGERGYLDTMGRLFTKLGKITHGNQSVLVLDDDAVLDCNFKARLKSVLDVPRCGVTSSLSSESAGALLLGAAVWIDGTYPARGGYCAGWRLTDAELSVLPSGSRKCHNVHSKTFGSFAVLYHPGIFQLVVDWVATSTSPFDHIYPFLSRKKKIIRVAYPAIAIQDVRHESQIDPDRHQQDNFTHRAEIHRWQPLSRFCDPETSLPIKIT